MQFVFVPFKVFHLIWSIFAQKTLELITATELRSGLIGLYWSTSFLLLGILCDFVFVLTEVKLSVKWLVFFGTYIFVDFFALGLTPCF